MTDAEDLAARVLQLCGERGIMLALAESCTGGMIAAAVTAIPGSSAVLDRGFVTYSNEAKTEMLCVRSETLKAHGAVSAETAKEMADGALRHSRAALALSVTGIAGPGGGSAEKPVGLVWFGLALGGAPTATFRRVFPDHGRDSIRREAVQAALRLAVEALSAAQAAAGSP